MLSLVYLSLLSISLIGMLVIDYRYSLALFYDRQRTLKTLAVSVAVFVLWDIGGIALGIFFTGESKYITGLKLGPEFPIEEIIFLSFLCYFTLIIYRLMDRLR